MIKIDRIGQRGIVSEFVPLLVKFARLTKQETPLLLRVERRNLAYPVVTHTPDMWYAARLRSKALRRSVR